MLFQYQVEQDETKRKKKKEEKRSLYRLVPRMITLFGFLDASFAINQGPRSYERLMLSWDAQYQFGLDEIERKKKAGEKYMRPTVYRKPRDDELDDDDEFKVIFGLKFNPKGNKSRRFPKKIGKPATTLPAQFVHRPWLSKTKGKLLVDKTLSPISLITNKFDELMNANLFEPEYLPFKCKFYQKRDAFKHCRKPKYRAKFRDTFHQLNTSQPLASQFLSLLFWTFFYFLCMAGTVGSLYRAILYQFTPTILCRKYVCSTHRKQHYIRPHWISFKLLHILTHVANYVYLLCRLIYFLCNAYIQGLRIMFKTLKTLFVQISFMSILTHVFYFDKLRRIIRLLPSYYLIGIQTLVCSLTDPILNQIIKFDIFEFVFENGMNQKTTNVQLHYPLSEEDVIQQLYFLIESPIRGLRVLIAALFTFTNTKQPQDDLLGFYNNFLLYYNSLPKRLTIFMKNFHIHMLATLLFSWRILKSFSLVSNMLLLIQSFIFVIWSSYCADGTKRDYVPRIKKTFPIARGGADSGSTPKGRGRPTGTKKYTPQRIHASSGQFVSPTSSKAPSIDRRTKSQRRSQISSHISSQRSRDRKGRFTPATSELIDTLDDRLIRTQYIEGTPSNAQGRLSDYTRDTQEGFTQDTLFTDWAQGDESSRLIVDLEAPTFGFKRVKKTVKKPDKPAPNEQTDTPPPEPTITLYDPQTIDLFDGEAELREQNRSKHVNAEIDDLFVRRWSQRIQNQEKNKPPPIVRWQYSPITQRCMDVSGHKGLGCASVSANHIPAVYRTLRPNGENRDQIVACPFCNSLIVPRLRALILANRKKCPHCRNGKVVVKDQLQAYNAPFRNPQMPFFHLTCLDNVERTNLKTDVLHFCQFAYEYNRLFQYASPSLNFAQDIPRRENYTVIKINNAIHFRQSSYVPPADRSRPARYAQIFTLRPEDIEGFDISVTGQKLTEIVGKDGKISTHNRANVEAQLMRRDDQATKNDLNSEIVRRLHEWFAANSWMAKAYFHAREVYEHAKNEAEAQGKQVPQVSFVLLGQKAAQEAKQKIKDKQDRNIFRKDVHPHLVQVPAQRFENEFNELYGHVAQIYISDPSCEPPELESGVNVVLRGPEREVAPLRWDNQHLVASVFPLLNPLAEPGYQRAMPLKKPESDDRSSDVTQSQQTDRDAAEKPTEEDQKFFDSLLEDCEGQLIQDPIFDDDNDPIEYELPSDEEEPQIDQEAIIEPPLKTGLPLQGRKYLSRNQWTRAMIGLVAEYADKRTGRLKKWCQTYNWIWWSNSLAELFILTQWHTTLTEVALWIKSKQKDLRKCLAKTLIAYYQKQLDYRNEILGKAKEIIGSIFFAPATYRGSRRMYQRAYADAMALIREFGAPHLFVTFTMDHDNPDLKQMLYHKQHSASRPEIVAQVFNDRLYEFQLDLGLINPQRRDKETLARHSVLGPVKAWFYSLEYQKGGNPHVHFVIILDWEKMETMWASHGRELTPETYMDEYITAEIPELPDERDNSPAAIAQRDYHQFVITKLYHTCAVKRCKEKEHDRCSKRFPKPFSQINVERKNRTPFYRRRPPPTANESFDPVKHGYAAGKKTNEYVVPHNRFLTLKYRSHINVEWAYGDETAKYVTKYAMKGVDMAFVAVKSREGVANVDEFHELNLARYVTSQEAMMAIFGMSLVKLSHPVTTLYVSDPENPNVIYEADEEEEKANELIYLAEEEQPLVRNQLAMYLELNKTLDPEERNLYTFATIAKKFRWSGGKWIRRTEKFPFRGVIRIGHVSPANKKLHALRALAYHVRGPTSWTDYKTHNGKTYDSYFHTAVAMGLCDDDQYVWRESAGAAMRALKTLRERVYWMAVFLIKNMPNNPKQIVEDNLQYLAPKAIEQPEQRMKYFLLRLEYILRRRGYQPQDAKETCGQRIGLPWVDLPHISNKDLVNAAFFPSDLEDRFLGDLRNKETTAERNEGQTGVLAGADYEKLHHEFYAKANVEQKEFFEIIKKALICRKNEREQKKAISKKDAHIPRLHFLTGDGGVGKTFLYNLIISWAKKEKLFVAPCASTGLAASDLIDGQTAHSRFKIKPDVKGDTEPIIYDGQLLSEVIRLTDLIILDEVSALHVNVLKFIDKSCRMADKQRAFHQDSTTLEETPIPFASKIVILGGDWKQLAPIEKDVDIRFPDKRNMHLAQSKASIKNSEYFEVSQPYHFRTTRLRTNNRLLPGQYRFRDFLKFVGAGLNTDRNFSERIQIPDYFKADSEQALFDFVFTHDALLDPMNNIPDLKGSAIIVPLLSEVKRIHTLLLDKLPGETQLYYGIDQGHESHPADRLAINAAKSGAEYIHNQTPPGVADYELLVKPGAIMTVCQNISVEQGIVNGTRVQVLECEPDYIKCRHITGYRGERGETFLLSRFKFQWGGEERAFNGGGIRFTRSQFPLIPGFVLTINKAQGQTLQRVGLNLTACQCFSHGHMYVACSRAQSEQGLRILLKGGVNEATNIVQRSLLDQEDKDEAVLAHERFQHNAYIPYQPLANDDEKTPIELQTPRLISYSQINITEDDQEEPQTPTTPYVPPYISQNYDTPASGRLFESSTSSESTQMENVGPYQPRGRMQAPQTLTTDQQSYSNLLRQYTQSLDMVLSEDLFSGQRPVDIVASALGTDAQPLGIVAEQLERLCLDPDYFNWLATEQLPQPGASVFTGQYLPWARYWAHYILDPKTFLPNLTTQQAVTEIVQNLLFSTREHCEREKSLSTLAICCIPETHDAGHEVIEYLFEAILDWLIKNPDTNIRKIYVVMPNRQSVRHYETFVTSLIDMRVIRHRPTLARRLQQMDLGQNQESQQPISTQRRSQTIDSDAVREIIERYQGPVRVVLESQLLNKNIRPDIVATAVDLQHQPVGQQSIQLHQQMGAAVRNDLSSMRQLSFPGIVQITSRGNYPYTRSYIAHYVIPPHLPADNEETRSFCRKLIYNILYDSQARRESSLAIFFPPTEFITPEAAVTVLADDVFSWYRKNVKTTFDRIYLLAPNNTIKNLLQRRIDRYLINHEPQMRALWERQNQSSSSSVSQTPTQSPLVQPTSQVRQTLPTIVPSSSNLPLQTEIQMEVDQTTVKTIEPPHELTMDVDQPMSSSPEHQPSIFAMTGFAEGDGNCFFRAVALALMGIDNNLDHRILRRFAIDFLHNLYNYGDVWRTFLDQNWDFDRNLHRNMQNYLNLMRSPAKNALDEARWGHAQLGLIMAEILGRTVTVIVPDRSTGTETAWTYTPGFAATYGYLATIQLEGGAHLMDLEQLAQMQLNGRTNYQYLFEDPTRPNPIVIRWNGGDHYEPVLQNVDHGQYFAGNLRELIRQQARISIERANALNPTHPPLQFPADIVQPARQRSQSPGAHGGSAVREVAPGIQIITLQPKSTPPPSTLQTQHLQTKPSMQPKSEMQLSTPSRTTSPTSPHEEKNLPYMHKMAQFQSLAQRKAEADARWKQKIQSESTVISQSQYSDDEDQESTTEPTPCTDYGFEVSDPQRHSVPEDRNDQNTQAKIEAENAEARQRLFYHQEHIRHIQEKMDAKRFRPHPSMFIDKTAQQQQQQPNLIYGEHARYNLYAEAKRRFKQNYPKPEEKQPAIISVAKKGIKKIGNHMLQTFIDGTTFKQVPRKLSQTSSSSGASQQQSSVEETIKKDSAEFPYYSKSGISGSRADLTSISNPAHEVCAICHNHLDNGEKCGQLECGHIFHSDCIKRWLLSACTCPTCRRHLVAYA